MKGDSSVHCTNDKYRDGYDRIFKHICEDCKGRGEKCLERGAWVPCECQSKKKK